MRFQRNRMAYLALLGALPWLSIVHAQSAPQETSVNHAEALPGVVTGFDRQQEGSHWGLGAGIGGEALPYKGDRTRVEPVPLVFYENRWISVVDTKFEFKAWQGDGFTFSLQTQLGRFDGFDHKDAAIFRGMANRTGTIWYGPHASWHYGLFSVSSDYLFSSKGQRGTLSFQRGFRFGRWTIAPHVGFTYFDRKYVGYYYGVRPDEATPVRPVYLGKSTINATAGVSATWQWDAHQVIRGNVGITQFGSGITDSPLVGRKKAPGVLVLYIYRFK